VSPGAGWRWLVAGGAALVAGGWLLAFTWAGAVALGGGVLLLVAGIVWAGIRRGSWHDALLWLVAALVTVIALPLYINAAIWAAGGF
jgi:hypothetical protein